MCRLRPGRGVVPRCRRQEDGAARRTEAGHRLHRIEIKSRFIDGNLKGQLDSITFSVALPELA